ncbi:unnamed protein product [Sphenostylis stenocarpa]|uniref:Uncharacterized protein n=1 Tax=Sphenostylis stenocarpa TaxID=92480 RepID=A0AA86VH98_9FABA|nr:unnamed protein product [Sphenostylis stenocarpa]
MSRSFLTLFHALLLLLLNASGFSVGFSGSRKSGETKCRERERQALLNIKQSLIDKYGMLSTWSDDHNNTNCCKWKGIQCNNQTGHVQVLDLHGNFGSHHLEGAINLTSLTHLQYIQYLDLSNNDFPWSHIPQLIGSFTNLRYLDLSFCLFGGNIPSKLGNLSKLQYLNLGGNNLWGPIPFQIGNLSHLQYLDLGDSYLIGEIPFEIGNLKRLKYLNLMSYSLSGTLLFQNGNLPLLHALRLRGNFDIKVKNAEWLSNLSSLTILEMTSLHNLSSSRQWLQSISKLIPDLKELKLVDCSLSDADIKSLFHSHSNFSTSLTVLALLEKCQIITEIE